MKEKKEYLKQSVRRLLEAFCNKVVGGLQPYSKRDSDTGVFLRILWNFWEQLFHRTTLGDFFCNEKRKYKHKQLYLKERLRYRCFRVNFAKFLRTPFLTEHLPWLLFFTDNAIRLRNFEFRKKNVPLLTKDIFFRSFQSCKFFSRKGGLCKIWNLKAIRSN